VRVICSRIAMRPRRRTSSNQRSSPAGGPPATARFKLNPELRLPGTQAVEFEADRPAQAFGIVGAKAVGIGGDETIVQLEGLSSLVSRCVDPRGQKEHVRGVFAAGKLVDQRLPPQECPPRLIELPTR
jgi:hypothetical protein